MKVSVAPKNPNRNNLSMAGLAFPVCVMNCCDRRHFFFGRILIGKPFGPPLKRPDSKTSLRFGSGTNFFSSRSSSTVALPMPDAGTPTASRLLYVFFSGITHFLLDLYARFANLLQQIHNHRS